MKKKIPYILIALAMSLSLNSCNNNDDDATEMNQANSSEEITTPEDPSKFVPVNFENVIEKMVVPKISNNTQNLNALELKVLISNQRLLAINFNAEFIIPSTTFLEGIAEGTPENITYTQEDINGDVAEYTLKKDMDKYIAKHSIFKQNELSFILFEGFMLTNKIEGNISLGSDENDERLTLEWNVSDTNLNVKTDVPLVNLDATYNNDGSGTAIATNSDGIVKRYHWNADGSGSVTFIETDETFTWTLEDVE